MPKPLRIIFAGTPDFAASHLAKLLISSYQIVGVFTQPDRPAGRGQKPSSSPVKKLAFEHDLAIFQPASLISKEDQKLVFDLQADIMVVVAYGLLLPQAVLNMPALGCINIHGSLLPLWRGAAPIQRSIWAGNDKTGITVIQMDAGLDTGPLLHSRSCFIHSAETSATLYDKLASLGPQALLETLDQIQSGTSVAKKQDNALATYAKKLSKEEARLDWSLSATQLERCVRAFNPWPASYFTINEQTIKVWQANVLPLTKDLPPGSIIRADKHGLQIATNDGILNITRLQPAGKKEMSAQDFINSRQKFLKVGNSLT